MSRLVCQVTEFGWSAPELADLHPPLNFVLQQQPQALIGLNGCGKSLLLQALAGGVLPYGGQIQWQCPRLWLPQQWQLPTQSVAAYLGLADVLAALERISQGVGSDADFELADGQWLVQQQTQQILAELELPVSPQLPLQQLSPGQQMKLRLYKALSSKAFLLLDEVSNHLDQWARQWLADQLTNYAGGFLLVSHDEELLQQMPLLWQLSAQGLERSSLCYDEFLRQQNNLQQQRQLDVVALKRAIRVQHTELMDERQKNQNRNRKAAEHAKQANQAPVLLGRRAGQAQKSASRRQQEQQQTLEAKKAEVKVLESSHWWIEWPTLWQQGAECPTGWVVQAAQLDLLAGGQIQWRFGDRIALTGRNGSGKSSLLKQLTGEWPVQQGWVQRYRPLFYLDQHFSCLQPELTVLDNLQALSGVVDVTVLRTALARVGFQRAQATALVTSLSGGEQLKLVLLALSLRAEPTFLLLDEPDNHLDYQARQMLTQFLQAYSPGYALVSHRPQWLASLTTVQLQLPDPVPPETAGNVVPAVATTDQQAVAAATNAL